MMNDSSEELLNFRVLVHQPGNQVVHIWSRKVYSVEKYLGKSSIGHPHYYVKDDKGSVSTMDSTEVAPAEHRIVKVLAYWREKLRQSGKSLIVVGHQRDPTRLVCWFISEHSEYSPLANSVRKNVDLLYYWTL